MNATDYESKVTNMLTDDTFYNIIKDDDTDLVKYKSNDLLKQIHEKGYLDDKQLRHLSTYKAQLPIFYGLPKIHKPNAPLRPIVSQIHGPTHGINIYIHHLLETAEIEIPNLFKDTTAFLNYVENYKDTDTNEILLVTMDVCSLYTNIPHTEAISLITEHYQETLKYWHKYNNNLKPVDTDTLKSLLEHMLHNCNFGFNNIIYKQKYGTPMGANASVRIANIYMHKLLKKCLNDYKDVKPTNLGRLIDDIFFIWIHGEESLLKFVNYLNTYHTTIKYELHYSSTSVNFLDTTVYIKDNKIHTKLYIKPTDKKQYLHYSSCHPTHVKKAIPYSQALRYRRIIDDDDELKLNLHTLLNKFVNRGYPTEHVNTQINKIFLKTRTETLQYKTQKQKEEEFNNFVNNGPFLPLIITYKKQYDTGNKRLYNIFNELWLEFINTTNENIKECFINTSPKIIFKKGQTLGNLLIKAKFDGKQNATIDTTDYNLIQILAQFNAENTTESKVTKCNNLRCKTCQIIQETDDIYSYTTKQTHTIFDKMNCSTKSVIYIITCNLCKKQYVGETKRSLKERVNNHRSDIKHNKNTAIAKHFNDILHTYKNLLITPIEIAENNEYRKHREQFWISILNTKYPHGLNNYPLIYV